MREKLTDMPKVTKVEVIDKNGIQYNNDNCAYVQIHIQDYGKTMQVFLFNKEKTDGKIT